MASTDDLRRWATALPEVAESSHFRFRVPIFKVHGRTFVGLGRDETTAVFCLGEPDADAEAAASPSTCRTVRRQDARRSFLGLEVDLADTRDERLSALVEQAWRQHAPKRLVATHDAGVV